MSLYENIQNPLTDEVINYFLNVYLNKGNLYEAAIKANSKNKINEGFYSVSNRDKLYTNLFNLWKKSILGLSKEEIKRMVDYNIVGNDFFKLKDLIENGISINSRDEYFRLVQKEKLLEKYGWHNFGYGEWIHINSYDLTYGISEKFETEHRLYLNPSPTDTDYIVNNFIYECAKMNIPFYLKYDSYGDRDDTIVIYSNTQNLENYISILNDILKKHPDIKERLSKPPVLSGKINEVIGYGSQESNARTSFNKKRTDIIQRSIEEALFSVLKKDLRNLSDLDLLIVRNNPDFITIIRKQIGENSLLCGIDDNFCFDTDKKELLQTLEIKKD